MNRRSVRFRVSAAATMLATAFLLAVGVVLVSVVRTQLADSLDDSLHQRADAVAATVGAGLPAPVFEDIAIRLVRASGTVTTGGDPAVEVPPAVGPGAHTVRGSRGEVRVVSSSISLPDGPAVLQLASRRDDVTGPIGVLVRALLVTIPAAVAGIAGLTWWLAGRTLRPVAAIGRELADITVSDLGRRVPEPGTGDEIDVLARTTNAALARLDASVERQQRFVADASHELRSPLARLRAAIEVDVADPAGRDPDRTSAALLRDTIALQRLVDDLLLLAVADARRGVASSQQVVDLGAVATDEARALAERGRVVVDLSGVAVGDAVRVRGDQRQLARVVRNLLDNAERHAATRVSVVVGGVEATGTDSLVRLVVHDDGPGVPRPERQRVFERFARVDDARSSRDGGAGLGLAIVHEIVRQHGGTVAVGDGSGGEFVVLLPAAPAGNGDRPEPYDAPEREGSWSHRSDSTH